MTRSHLLHHIRQAEAAGFWHWAAALRVLYAQEFGAPAEAWPVPVNRADTPEKSREPHPID